MIGSKYMRMLAQNKDLLNVEFERSMLSLLAAAVIICLLVYRHIRSQRKNKEIAREIMEKCEEEKRPNSRDSGF